MAAYANPRAHTYTLHPTTTQVGSAKTLDKPALPGSGFKILGEEGYDDGGVADLSLLIDLEDSVQRRKRGENEYFSALRADLLPRATRGPMAKQSRREQKVSLAQLLFSEDEDCEDKGPSEVYVEQVSGEEDEATKKHRRDRLAQAKAALRLSLLLREPACASLSLSELCKRKLTEAGKEGALEALRCADKALEISGTGFWDSDEVQLEVRELEHSCMLTFNPHFHNIYFISDRFKIQLLYRPRKTQSSIQSTKRMPPLPALQIQPLLSYSPSASPSYACVPPSSSVEMHWPH